MAPATTKGQLLVAQSIGLATGLGSLVAVDGVNYKIESNALCDGLWTVQLVGSVLWTV